MLIRKYSPSLCQKLIAVYFGLKAGTCRHFTTRPTQITRTEINVNTVITCAAKDAKVLHKIRRKQNLEHSSYITHQTVLEKL